LSSVWVVFPILPVIYVFGPCHWHIHSWQKSFLKKQLEQVIFNINRYRKCKSSNYSCWTVFMG